VSTKAKNVTKAECFQELIRKVLRKDVELEEIKGANGVGFEGESRDSKRETTSNMDRGFCRSRQ